MKFSTSEKDGMGLFAFFEWGFAKVDESEYKQYLLAAQNRRIMISRLKNKKSAVGVNNLNSFMKIMSEKAERTS